MAEDESWGVGEDGARFEMRWDGMRGMREHGFLLDVWKFCVNIDDSHISLM